MTQIENVLSNMPGSLHPDDDAHIEMFYPGMSAACVAGLVERHELFDGEVYYSLTRKGRKAAGRPSLVDRIVERFAA